jgi:hypothetical protein
MKRIVLLKILMLMQQKRAVYYPIQIAMVQQLCACSNLFTLPTFSIVRRLRRQYQQHRRPSALDRADRAHKLQCVALSPYICHVEVATRPFAMLQFNEFNRLQAPPCTTLGSIPTEGSSFLFKIFHLFCPSQHDVLFPEKKTFCPLVY